MMKTLGDFQEKLAHFRIRLQTYKQVHKINYTFCQTELLILYTSRQTSV